MSRRLRKQDSMELTIRRARPEECGALTEITFAAKAYWQYPKQYYTIWRDQLTITGHYIEENHVYLAERDNAIIGYFSVIDVRGDFCSGPVVVEKGYWLEHIFIRPGEMYKGVGSVLMEQVRQLCREQGAAFFRLFCDPYSQGFYEKHGAVLVGEVPSSVEDVQLLVYRVDLAETPEQRTAGE